MLIYSEEFERLAAATLNLPVTAIADMRTSRYPGYASRSYNIEIMWKMFCQSRGITIEELADEYPDSRY